MIPCTITQQFELACRNKLNLANHNPMQIWNKSPCRENMNNFCNFCHRRSGCFPCWSSIDYMQETPIQVIPHFWLTEASSQYKEKFWFLTRWDRKMRICTFLSTRINGWRNPFHRFSVLVYWNFKSLCDQKNPKYQSRERHFSNLKACHP